MGSLRGSTSRERSENQLSRGDMKSGRCKHSKDWGAKAISELRILKVEQLQVMRPKVWSSHETV